ncbi:MAG: zf-HC2 domain-containing protein [Anaerolineae bacterium]|nr:zf-HC2 domain-containing protein [Anaerolineae bacterium]
MENDLSKANKKIEHLLAYLDGEIGPELKAQIEASPADLHHAHNLAQTQKELTTQLYRVDCPASILLGEYHLGVISPEQRDSIKQHLVSCPHCARELGHLALTLDDSTPNEEQSAFQTIKTITAELISRALDEFSQAGIGRAPAFGLRGASEEEIYVYEADGVQIVIDLQEDTERPGHKSLLGLVTGLAAQQFKIEMLLDDKVIARANIDELGNFVIASIPPDEYQLNISGPEVEIRILTLKV